MAHFSKKECCPQTLCHLAKGLQTNSIKYLCIGALVQWLWEMTHDREVVGSNPLDGIDIFLH